MSSKLLVDNIEGRTGQGFLTPDRPAFSAFMSSNQSNRSTNTNHTVDFDSTLFDIGSNLIQVLLNILCLKQVFISLMLILG